MIVYPLVIQPLARGEVVGGREEFKCEFHSVWETFPKVILKSALVKVQQHACKMLKQRWKEKERHGCTWKMG